MKKEITTQHTKGEWKWNDVHDCTHTRDIKSNGKTIATVWVYNKGEKVIDEYEAQANAEHIVKCVNTHDDLVNTLQECIREFKCYDMQKETLLLIDKINKLVSPL